MNKGLLLASALAIAIPAAFGGNAIAPLVSLGEARAAWGASAQPLSSLLQPHQWVNAGQWVNTGGLHPQDARRYCSGGHGPRRPFLPHLRPLWRR